MNKKIIILGDRTRPRWHPVSNLEPLVEALHSKYEFTVTEEYPELTGECLERFDACINYIDNWQDRGTLAAQEAICEYVRKGGRMLTLHNGIITKSAEPLLRLNGGSFTGHANYSELEYRSIGTNKELNDGTESFQLFDEPYQYVFFHREAINLFLEYQYEGQWYPAGWWLPSEKGRVVYLAPGHDREAFRNPLYIRQIENALRFIL